jgi:hypothetical protein
MLSEIIDSESFEREFNKRFSSFCIKAPLSLSYVTVGGRLKLYKGSNDFILEYPFDYSKSVKENIFEIKKILVKDYFPKFCITEKREVEVSKEVLQEKYEKGEISIDNLLEYKEFEIKEVWFTLEKIIYKRDELFLINEEGERFHYKMKMPVIYFVKGLIEDKYDDPGVVFLEKSYLIQQR